MSVVEAEVGSEERPKLGTGGRKMEIIWGRIKYIVCDGDKAQTKRQGKAAKGT